MDLKVKRQKLIAEFQQMTQQAEAHLQQANQLREAATLTRGRIIELTEQIGDGTAPAAAPPPPAPPPAKPLTRADRRRAKKANGKEPDAPHSTS